MSRHFAVCSLLILSAIALTVAGKDDIAAIAIALAVLPPIVWVWQRRAR